MAAIALLLFAAFAAAGFTRLPAGHRARRPWAAGAAALVLVGVLVTGGTRFLKHPAYGPFDQDEDSARIQVPPPGFQRATVGRRFTAYVRC